MENTHFNVLDTTPPGGRYGGVSISVKCEDKVGRSPLHVEKGGPGTPSHHRLLPSAPTQDCDVISIVYEYDHMIRDERNQDTRLPRGQ